MLPISTEVLLEELDSAQRYLARMLETFRSGVEYPQTGLSADEPLDMLRIRQLCAELKVVAAKCDSLSEIVMEALVGS